MPLSQFAEPIESVGGVFKAYRMDSTKKGFSMRDDAGLGTCECCDYVTVSKDNQSVVLIEETDLEGTIIGFKEKYDYLNDDDQVELALRRQFLERTVSNFTGRCWSSVACQARGTM